MNDIDYQHAFTKFLNDMNHSGVPAQKDPNWLVWRNNQQELSGSQVAVLGSTTGATLRMSGSSRNAVVESMIHGHIFEELNGQLLSIIINQPIHPARTLSNVNIMATSDGFTWIGNRGWFIEIKSPFVAETLFFSMNYLLQMYWTFLVTPPLIAGGILHAHCWRPITRQIKQAKNLGWALLRLNQPVDQETLTGSSFLRAVYSGNNVTIVSFYLTPDGIDEVIKIQQKIGGAIKVGFKTQCGYISFDPPTVRWANREIVYAWQGGFTGIIMRQTFDNLLYTIAK